MNTNVKTCLFGGALLGAGLCSSASAADVNWSYGLGMAKTNSTLLSDNATGPYSSWYADTSDGAHSTGGTFGFDMLADSGSTGYGYSFSYALFTVATDTTLLISWDLNGNGDDAAYISTVLYETTGSGSLEFTFLATVTYRVTSYIYDYGNGAGPSSFSMGETTVNVVPLPPAAFGGLGMLAGLGAYRRIRR